MVAEDPYDIEPIEHVPTPPPAPPILRPRPALLRPETVTPEEPDSPEVAEAREAAVKIFNGLGGASLLFGVWMLGKAVVIGETRKEGDDGAAVLGIITSVVMGLFLLAMAAVHLILARLTKDRHKGGVEFGVIAGWGELALAGIALVLSILQISSSPPWVGLVVQTVWVGVMVKLILVLKVVKRGNVRVG